MQQAPQSPSLGSSLTATATTPQYTIHAAPPHRSFVLLRLFGCCLCHTFHAALFAPEGTLEVDVNLYVSRHVSRPLVVSIPCRHVGPGRHQLHHYLPMPISSSHVQRSVAGAVLRLRP